MEKFGFETVVVDVVDVAGVDVADVVDVAGVVDVVVDKSYFELAKSWEQPASSRKKDIKKLLLSPASKASRERTNVIKRRKTPTNTSYPFDLCYPKCRFSTDRIKQRSRV